MKKVYTLIQLCEENLTSVKTFLCPDKAVSLFKEIVEEDQMRDYPPEEWSEYEVDGLLCYADDDACCAVYVVVSEIEE